jgi:hypothetical protein
MKNTLRSILLALGFALSASSAVVHAAEAQPEKGPAIIVEDTFLLVRVNAAEAQEIADAINQLRKDGPKDTTWSVGILDNPQDLKKGQSIITFQRRNDAITYFVEKVDGAYEPKPDYILKGAAYLLFWKPRPASDHAKK